MSTGKKIAVVFATLAALLVGGALPADAAPVTTDTGEPGCC